MPNSTKSKDTDGSIAVDSGSAVAATKRAEERAETKLYKDTTRPLHGEDNAEVVQNATAIEKSDGERSNVGVATEKRAYFSVPRNRNALIVALVALVAIAAIYFLFFRNRGESQKLTETASAEKATSADETGAAGEVKLSSQALTAANIQIEGVTRRPAVALLRTTGTVEANPQRTQRS